MEGETMKRITLLLSSILLLFALTACNVKENRNEMGGARKAPAEVEQPAAEDEGAEDVEGEDTDMDDAETSEDTETDSDSK